MSKIIRSAIVANASFGGASVAFVQIEKPLDDSEPTRSNS